jgi:class 3 adenylate cyclase
MNVHRAARIAATAHGGQVVLSEATRALAMGDMPDGVSVLDLAFAGSRTSQMWSGSGSWPGGA